MAQHKSALKRARASETRNERNTANKSKMKTLVKKVRTEKDKEKAAAALKEAASFLDKISRKRVIHPNKAANQKSKLTKLVSKMK